MMGATCLTSTWPGDQKYKVTKKSHKIYVYTSWVWDTISKYAPPPSRCATSNMTLSERSRVLKGGQIGGLAVPSPSMPVCLPYAVRSTVSVYIVLGARYTTTPATKTKQNKKTPKTTCSVSCGGGYM